MLTIERYRRAARLVVMAAVLIAALLPRLARGQPAEIAPKAEKLLKAATAYLAGQKHFRVLARSTIEVVLTSGQNLQVVVQP